MDKVSSLQKSIFEDLKRAYVAAHMVVDTKEIFEALAADEGLDLKGCPSAYEVRLLTIYYSSTMDGETADKTPLCQLKVRHTDGMNEGEEEMVMMLMTSAAKKTITNIDDDLMEAAHILEVITQKYVADFPDDMLWWNYMGDDDEVEEDDDNE